MFNSVEKYERKLEKAKKRAAFLESAFGDFVIITNDPHLAEGAKQGKQAPKASKAAASGPPRPAEPSPSSLSMDCEKCGAHLDLDLENLVKFCPYCGNKIMLDPSALRDVLLAKEETKRQTLEYQHEDAIRREEDEKRPGKIKATIVLAVLSFVMIIGSNFIDGTTGSFVWLFGWFSLLGIPFVWVRF
ncbi:MAG: hypothetical protein Q4E12_05360 [Coriobacteriia bacterium]|nr:hypothetical protein [Coriobacteriia bacterium]